MEVVRVAGPGSNTAALSALHVSTNPFASGQTGRGFERSGSKREVVRVAGPGSNTAALSALHVSTNPIASGQTGLERSAALVRQGFGGHLFAPGARRGWLATRSPQGEGWCRIGDSNT